MRTSLLAVLLFSAACGGSGSSVVASSPSPTTERNGAAVCADAQPLVTAIQTRLSDAISGGWGISGSDQSGDTDADVAHQIGAPIQQLSDVIAEGGAYEVRGPVTDYRDQALALHDLLLSGATDDQRMVAMFKLDPLDKAIRTACLAAGDPLSH